MSLTCALGLRAVGPYGNSGAPAGRFGNWSRLHLHDTQAPAARDQGRGQKPHSGGWPSLASSCLCSNAFMIRHASTRPNPPVVTRTAWTMGTRWTRPKSRPTHTFRRSRAGQASLLATWLRITCPTWVWWTRRRRKLWPTATTCNNNNNSREDATCLDSITRTRHNRLNALFHEGHSLWCSGCNYMVD